MVRMEQIEELSRHIAERFKPLRIILFGSYAIGSPDEDSDVDLFVEMPFDGSIVEQSVKIRLSRKPDFPLDLVVRTPEKVAERLAIGDRFIRDILGHGKVLYEGRNP